MQGMYTHALHAHSNATSAGFGADSMALSFESAEDLPSHSWQPPKLALLQLGDEAPEPMPALALGAVEAAWADTVRATL
jgi:hypothetical protein